MENKLQSSLIFHHFQFKQPSASSSPPKKTNINFNWAIIHVIMIMRLVFNVQLQLFHAYKDENMLI